MAQTFDAQSFDAQTLVVNPIDCTGHGVSAELLPELISLDEWGYPLVDPRPVPPALDRDAPDVRDERKVRLGDLLARVDRLAYLYDFGDSWRHEVVVDEVLLGDEVGEVPRLEAGARACPPEDVGGGPGYADLLDGLAGRGSAWAQEVAESYEGFDPERFDLAPFDRYVR